MPTIKYLGRSDCSSVAAQREQLALVEAMNTAR